MSYRTVGEHRAVAALALGRPLRPGEVVHHINGDKRDNRPENLMVFPSQAAHVRHHRPPKAYRRVNVRVTPELRQAFVSLARLHGRSVSDEIRLALSLHTEAAA